MRTLTRGPYSVRYKGSWLYFQKTPTHTHTVWSTSEGQSQGISVFSSFRRKTGSIRPTSSAEGSISRLRKPGRGGGGCDIVISFLFFTFPFLFLTFWFSIRNGKVKNENEITLCPPLGFRSLHHLLEDLFYSFLLFCSEILLITVYKTSRLVSCINFHGCLHFGSYFWKHLRHFCWRYT